MIKINGKEYDFKIGTEALVAFEEMTGVDPSNLQGLGFTNSIKLMYCGIKSPDFSFKEFLRFVDDDETIMDTLTKLSQESKAATEAIAEEAKK